MARSPRLEGLEGRQLLVASIGSIQPVTVPQSLGYQVALDGTAANAPQTFSVVSDNPNVKVSVAQGKFLTVNLKHDAASGATGDLSFEGSVTFQLFEDYTPMTAGKIASFVNQNYYNGKTIHRIAGNFSQQNQPFDFVIQGGAPNADGTGSSGLPGTPFALELDQRLAYVNPGSLAMARSSSPNSNDTQFFFTTGTPTSLNYNYTIFGQVVSGFDTITKLTQVATTTNSGLGNEKSQPLSPVTIVSATLSDTNPNGVIHVDATGAVAGETANVRVTAFDASTNSTALQTFKVTVGADTTTHPSSFTFKPLAFPVNTNVTKGQAANVQLLGTTQNPSNAAVKVQYSLVSQPTHGTITNFDANTGALTYTPAAGYTGADSFQYKVTNTGGTPSPLEGNTQTVTLDVRDAAVTPMNTRAVRVVNSVLLVTPKPRNDGGTNEIVVTQTSLPNSPANERIVVSVNGVIDQLQPLASSIDRVVIYGSRASDKVTVLPAVDDSIRVTLDGGRGGKNVLQAGAGSTRLHGWFGQNTLIGGDGENRMVGRRGAVKPRASANTKLVYLADRPSGNGERSGKFYHYENGKLVEGVAKS